MIKTVYLFILLALGSVAAFPQSHYGYRAKYHPFNSRGTQMVEVVFGVTDLSSVSGTDQWRRANPAVYIFRNRQGKILKAYNLCGAPVSDFKLLAPGDTAQKPQKHACSRYVIFDNCSITAAGARTWDDADLGKARYGLIDSAGSVIIAPRYELLVVADDKNMLLAKLGGKYGLLDENGKALSPFIYDDLQCWSYNGGTCLARSGGKYSYLNSGGTVISKRAYDHGEIFWSRRALVMLNHKYGYIDSTGAEVVPLEYDRAESFYGNAAIVGKGSKYGIINNTGQVVAPIEYDRIEPVYDGIHSVISGYTGYKGAKKHYFNLQGRGGDPLSTDSLANRRLVAQTPGGEAKAFLSLDKNSAFYLLLSPHAKGNGTRDSVYIGTFNSAGWLASADANTGFSRLDSCSLSFIRNERSGLYAAVLTQYISDSEHAVGESFNYWRYETRTLTQLWDLNSTGGKHPVLFSATSAYSARYSGGRKGASGSSGYSYDLLIDSCGHIGISHTRVTGQPRMATDRAEGIYHFNNGKYELQDAVRIR